MSRRLGSSIAVAALGSTLVFMPGCTEERKATDEKQPSVLRLAAGTSAAGSGLFAELMPAFERKYGVKVDVFASGSGAALQLARDGQADVVLVHAREAEAKFVTDGYGVNRRDVMYNDFVILGPPGDPARLRGETDVLNAFKVISGRAAPFISRNDNSGTNIRELSLWKLAEIQPQGPWYVGSGKSMLETLELASAQKAYLLSDRSTYLFNQHNLDLVVLVEGDERLFNPYGVIAVNPLNVSGVNFTLAMAFVDFVTSAQGQKIIGDYGKNALGKALFAPVAIY